MALQLLAKPDETSRVDSLYIVEDIDPVVIPCTMSWLRQIAAEKNKGVNKICPVGGSPTNPFF